MRAPSVLEQLAIAGVTLRLRNDGLAAEPKAALNDDLRAAIRNSKAELMAWLSQPSVVQAVQLFHEYADRHGFTPEDRIRDIPPVLQEPQAWTDYFLSGAAGSEQEHLATALSAASQERLHTRSVPMTAYPLLQQNGTECGRCWHQRMAFEPGPKGRRQFQWTCAKGHRILRVGYALEDVLIASPECNDFSDRSTSVLAPQKHTTSTEAQP